MINNKFIAPKGNMITLRMFVSPKNQQQANRGNSFALPDLNEQKLNVDEARTGDKKFLTREVNTIGRLMTGLKLRNAYLLYEEVHHYNSL